MDFIEAIILGLVQGLTEFLPISSSAHLRIVGELAGWGDPGATFTAITQIGTELAVVIFFWRDIVRIIAQWFRSLGRGGGGRRSAGIQKGDPDVRMGWLIIVGTHPDRDPRLPAAGHDRHGVPLAVDRGDRADRLRHPARARRPARRRTKTQADDLRTATAS